VIRAAAAVHENIISATMSLRPKPVPTPNLLRLLKVEGVLHTEIGFCGWPKAIELKVRL
jgi:hypothetical protein